MFVLILAVLVMFSAVDCVAEEIKTSENASSVTCENCDCSSVSSVEAIDEIAQFKLPKKPKLPKTPKIPGVETDPKKAAEEYLAKLVKESMSFKMTSIKPEIKPLDFARQVGDLKDIDKDNIPKFDVSFKMDVDIKNKSIVDLHAAKMAIEFYADSEELDDDDEPVGVGEIKEKMFLPKNKTVSYPTFVTVPISSTGDKVAKMLKGDKMFYKADGIIYFEYKGFEIPVDITLTEGEK